MQSIFRFALLAKCRQHFSSARMQAFVPPKNTAGTWLCLYAQKSPLHMQGTKILRGTTRFPVSDRRSKHLTRTHVQSYSSAIHLQNLRRKLRWEIHASPELKEAFSRWLPLSFRKQIATKHLHSLFQLKLL